MHKLRIGQKVQVMPCNCTPGLERYFGEITFVIAKVSFEDMVALLQPYDGRPYYELELMNDLGVRAKACESVLRPIYDGDAPASWETCAWRPKVRDATPA
jgi:hypothetical protein